VAARSGGFDELRGEPLYPPVQRDVVDLDAALGEQLFQVPVGEAEAQVPAHRQEAHLERELEPGEGRTLNLEARTGTTRAGHRASFPDAALHRCNGALRHLRRITVNPLGKGTGPHFDPSRLHLAGR